MPCRRSHIRCVGQHKLAVAVRRSCKFRARDQPLDDAAATSPAGICTDDQYGKQAHDNSCNCTHAHICMRTNTRAHTHTHTHTHASTHPHALLHTHTHACARTQDKTHVQTHTKTPIYMRMQHENHTWKSLGMIPHPHTFVLGQTRHTGRGLRFVRSPGDEVCSRIPRLPHTAGCVKQRMVLRRPLSRREALRLPLLCIRLQYNRT